MSNPFSSSRRQRSTPGNSQRPAPRRKRRHAWSRAKAAFLLLADIEEAETGDQGRVRHWLAQALKAPRDPAWVADGFVSDKWLPISPVTGRLDAFEWKAPFGQIEGPLEDGSRRLDRNRSSQPCRRCATSAGSPVNDHRIIELERAATIAEAVRPTPAPHRQSRA